MDQLRAMSVFVATVDAGSLSAAARNIGQPLTNVSRLLTQLEEHLGCILLDRSTRRLALTEPGSEYLETCRKVLEAINDAEQKIHGHASELSGDLTISAPVQFGRIHIVPIVSELLELYPRINARILLLDRVVDLMEEGVDVALRVGDLRDSSLIATRVATLRLVTCASPNYLARMGVPRNPSTLAHHDCVTFEGYPGGNRWVFKSNRFGRKVIRVRSRLSVNTADAALAGAVMSLGVTRLLSYQTQAVISQGHLIPVLRQFDDVEVPAHLVYLPSRSTNPRVREFVDLTTRRLRELSLS